MADYKVNLVNEEEPSIAEKEKKVLENAGVEVDSNDGNYKIDLNESLISSRNGRRPSSPEWTKISFPRSWTN